MLREPVVDGCYKMRKMHRNRLETASILSRSQTCRGRTPSPVERDLSRETQLNLRTLSMFYYIYVLLSGKDDKFYTGYTENVRRRFEDHARGRVESTKDRRPLRLIYSEACLDKRDATKREKYLKTYHGKMFIHKRLKSYLTGSKSF
jgi:putative endonuclease